MREPLLAGGCLYIESLLIASVTRRKHSAFAPALALKRGMFSSSAISSCRSWSFHCVRIARFCSEERHEAEASVSGETNTTFGFFIACCMFIFRSLSLLPVARISRVLSSMKLLGTLRSCRRCRIRSDSARMLSSTTSCDWRDEKHVMLPTSQNVVRHTPDEESLQLREATAANNNQLRSGAFRNLLNRVSCGHLRREDIELSWIQPD